MTTWLLAIFAGSHTAALFLWVDVSLSVVGRNLSFSPPPLCCAAVGLSHSDGEMRGAEKHSHADICSTDTKRGVKIEKKTNSVVQNSKINCYWRTTAAPSELIWSTIWTKTGLYQKPVHSEVQAYTTAEWRSRVCLDLEMWVRWDDCILPLERQRHIERARDWEKCMRRKTNRYITIAIYHYFLLFFKLCSLNLHWCWINRLIQNVNESSATRSIK